ncbi:MAG: hypothetical protein GY714_30685 [Desulfobacterales bacterium]|nr:hypothetical protein [Desulfobacterales bacterium]
MSFDLLVFDKDKAPSTKQDFLKWWEVQSEWEEGHDYEIPGIATERLRNWFEDITGHYPPMNGPLAYEGDDEEIEDKLVDYCIGKSLIYSSFPWSEAENAYYKVKELAEKHKLGFFNVSAGEVEILVPDDQGNYTKIE